MVVPFLLLLLSLAALAASFLPGLADFALVALPAALASLILLLLALRRPKPRRPAAPVWPRPGRAKASPNWINACGSNVMHWNDGTPKVETLRAVIFRLTELGFSPGVVFDANAGYRLNGAYQHDRALGRLLGLPEDRFMVVEKGTTADPIVLAAARDLGARIVSNDRLPQLGRRPPRGRHPRPPDPRRLSRWRAVARSGLTGRSGWVGRQVRPCRLTLLQPDGVIWHILRSLDGFVSDTTGSLAPVMKYAGRTA